MPLVYLGTGWFIGIWLASLLRLPIETLLLAVIIPILGLVLWRKDVRMRLVWASVLCALVGGVWFTLRLPHFDQNSLATYDGIGVVTIEGVIDAPPDVRDTYINLRVNADQLTLPDRSSRPINGVVLVRPGRPAEFHYGDRVRVTGELTTPPEFATFSYADFLARQGVYSLIDRPRISVLEQDRGSPLLAAIMGLITLWAIYLGRQAAALNSLFAAGILMTALDPNTLFDVGFQLSFVATLGLVIYATPFTRATEGFVTRLFNRRFAQQAVGLIKDALYKHLAFYWNVTLEILKRMIEQG